MNEYEPHSDYIPGAMTDEQAWETLKSVKISVRRGSGKTIFQSIIFEAEMHAFKALEEKVKGQKEQPTGEWETFEKCGMWHFLCRKCHHAYTVKYNFCPNCGAKMKEGEEE